MLVGIYDVMILLYFVSSYTSMVSALTTFVFVTSIDIVVIRYLKAIHLALDLLHDNLEVCVQSL